MSAGFIGINSYNIENSKQMAKGNFYEPNPDFDLTIFNKFFPNFNDFNEPILEEYIKIASSYINIGFFGVRWEYAISLFIAHMCTLYNQMIEPEVSEGQPVGSSGTNIGVISSKSAGDVSVSYDLTAVNSVEGYEYLKQTKYGLLLIGIIKSAGFVGGVYI